MNNKTYLITAILALIICLLPVLFMEFAPPLPFGQPHPRPKVRPVIVIVHDTVYINNEIKGTMQKD